MNKDSILLFTKDAFCVDYLPCYGNKYWYGKTPNFDELAEKGTLFTRFYTAAPSSAMAYMAMFTGKYPYEQEIMEYVPLIKSYSGKTLFDTAREKGFQCHVIWDEKWMTTSYLHSKCYGSGTIFHSLNELRQGVGFHNPHTGSLIADQAKEDKTLAMIENEVKDITSGDKVFVWFHLPHVINGRTGYGTDIDLHDKILGIMRKYFDDSNIFLSADHGNMNGNKGKIGYGFDVYEPAIRIPLITPRKNNLKVCDDLIINIDWEKILFGGDDIPYREIIISDCAYYAQLMRKTVFMYKNYRYIYNRFDNSEELYDIDWDPHQEFNLIVDEVVDIDRNVLVKSRELYFYPYWDTLPQIRSLLRNAKQEIWREPTRKHLIMAKIRSNKIIRFLLKPLLIYLKQRNKSFWN